MHQLIPDRHRLREPINNRLFKDCITAGHGTVFVDGQVSYFGAQLGVELACYIQYLIDVVPADITGTQRPVQEFVPLAKYMSPALPIQPLPSLSKWVTPSPISTVPLK